MSVAQAKKKVSVLTGKSIEDILAPKPVLYHIDEEHAIAIYPMSDGILMEVGDALDRIATTAHSVTSLMEGGFALSTLLTALPAIAKACVPEVTRLVASVTGISEECVSEWQEAHKIGIIKTIIEAEDVPLLLKNAQGLASQFRGLPAPKATQEILSNLPEKAASTEEPTTNS